MYTRDQVDAAVADAVSKARAAAEMSRNALMEEGRKRGFSDGFASGEQATLSNVASRAAVEAVETQARQTRSVSNFVIRAKGASLLGGSTLRQDKAMTMQSWQFLDLVTARITDLGYNVRMVMPLDKMPMLRQYESARVYLSVPEGFQAGFVSQFERMSLLDALGLLNRLYGFGLWVAAEEPIVWLGYYNAEPKPIINAPVEVRFDESRFAESDAKPLKERRAPLDIPIPKPSVHD